jgi:hypothetical protein
MAVENPPVPIENQAEVQPKILFQHGPVVQVELNEGRLRMVGVGISLVPFGPVIQMFAQMLHFSLNRFLGAMVISQRLGVFQFAEGRLDNLLIQRPNG